VAHGVPSRSYCTPSGDLASRACYLLKLFLKMRLRARVDTLESGPAVYFSLSFIKREDSFCHLKPPTVMGRWFRPLGSWFPVIAAACSGRSTPAAIDTPSPNLSSTDRCADSTCVDGRDPPHGALASSPPFWLPGVPTKIARSGHGAASYFPTNRHGKLVVVGGFHQVQLDTYEVFDPDTASWTTGTLPSAPCCRLPAASGPDGKVYFVYGDQHATWVYDGSWNTSLAPPPDGCVHAGLAPGADNLLYVLCSHDSQRPPNPLMTYDVAGDRWGIHELAPITAINPPWMTSLGSRVYVLGTSNGNGYSFDAFDVTTGSWSKLSAPSVPSLIVGAPDGRVYSIGGYDLQGSIFAPTNAVSAYDPATDRWGPVAPLTYNRYDHAVTVGPDGRLYALGGIYNGATETDSVEVYGPVVSVTPSLAMPGSKMTLTGSNFAAHATVRAFLLGPSSGAPLATGTTDATGALRAAVVFPAPSVAAGDYVITVVDDKSRFPVRVPFSLK
jgi:Kelch motif